MWSWDSMFLLIFSKQKPSWAFTKLTTEILLNQYFGNPSLQDKFWLWEWHPGPSWSLPVSPDQFQTYWMFLAVLHLLVFLLPPALTAPCPTSFLRHFKCSFPYPACSCCLPFITVCASTSPVSLLSCFDLSAIPLALLLPGICSRLTLHLQGLSCERFQWTQDGWGQTVRILRALHLHPGEVTPAGPLSYPARWYL